MVRFDVVDEGQPSMGYNRWLAIEEHLQELHAVMALQLVTAPTSPFIPELQPISTPSTACRCRSVLIDDRQPPISSHGLKWRVFSASRQ